MPKFNLKDYKKINGDDHIEMRLKEDHAPEKEEVSQGQLEEYRADEEPNQLTEKLLEDRRAGEATQLVERQLDTKSANYENKYRNPSAYEGDINKLEEKRLLNDPVEDEEYKAASEVSEGMRWWEKTDSEDGLKLAANDSEVKTAQISDQVEELSFDEPRFEQTVWDEDEDADKPVQPIDFPEEEFEIVEEDATGPEMNIVNEKRFSDPIPGIYMAIEYDPAEVSAQDAIMEAYLMVITENPELSKVITEENFNVSGDGVVTMRAIGEELKDAVEKQPVETPEVDTVFEEASFDVVESGGTNLYVGAVKVNIPSENIDRENIGNDVLDFIADKHPEVNITEDSLDYSGLSEGIIKFLVAEAPAETPDFPIEEASADSEVKTASKKKQIEIS